MNIIGKKILVEKLAPEVETASGIILPTSKQANNRGKVLYIGNKVEYLKVGDVVQYYPNTGVDYEFEGKSCLFLKEDQDIEIVLV